MKDPAAIRAEVIANLTEMSEGKIRVGRDDLPYLHQVCPRVEQGADVKPLIEKMKRVLARDKGGVAIAANQLVGHSERVFIMKPQPNASIFYVLVNPSLTRRKGVQESKEQCLSVAFPENMWGKQPGRPEFVIRRPREITIIGFNEFWKPVKYALTGFGARVACHELDHLNGILISDGIPPSPQQAAAFELTHCRAGAVPNTPIWQM